MPKLAHRAVSFLFFIVAMSFLAVAQAAGGTFLGKTLTPFPLGFDKATKGMVASNNDYIVGGVAQLGTKQMALVALLPDGRLDTSFGPNHDGKSIVTLNGNTDVWQLAWDPDNKYLLAGNTKSLDPNDPAHMSVARFNADGTLDTTFGGGKGYVELYVGTGDSGAYAVAVQSSDRKVLLGGYSTMPDGRRIFTVVRLNVDGSLDATFGNNGVYASSVEPVSDEIVRALLWQPTASGTKIVATGTANGYLPVLRLNPDGTPDPTFAGGGKLNTSAMVTGYDITNDGSGNLLIAGTAIDGGRDPNLAVIRITPAGNVDTSFGLNGVAMYLAGDASAHGFGLAWDADGHIVACGTADKPAAVGAGDYAIFVRFNADGTVDTTFGTAGHNYVDVAPDNQAYGIFKLGSGGYGIVGLTSSEGTNHLVFVLKHDGTLDTTFNATGIRDFDVGASTAYATSSAKQADGSVVVAGWRDLPGGNNTTTRSGAIVRYRTDGTLDPNFGVNGLVFVDPVLNSVAIQPDGKILAAGYLLQNQGGTNIPMMSFVRLNADGSRDTTFGSSGVLTIPATSSQEIINAVTVLADGRIVGAGDTISGTDTSSLFVRLTPSGSFDTTFGGTGKVVVNFVPNDTDFMYSMAIQPDGKVVGAGFGWGGSYDDILVVRLNPDGTVDTTFGRSGNGATFVDFNHASQAYAVTLSGDGHILAGGWVTNTSDDDFALARLNADGTLDNTFGNGNGLAQYNFAHNDRIRALGFSPSGSLVAAGESGGLFAVAQFVANGALDASFGTGGLVTQRMNAGNDVATGLQFQADGTLFVSGSATYVFGLARFTGSGGGTTLTATTTNLAASANPVMNSTTVTYTASVTSSLGTPDGTVTMTDNGTPFCSNVALVGGSAQCYTTMVGAGPHAITAQYNGTATYAPSSATMSETVLASQEINFALASNGGVASASSQLNSDYPIGAINDGETAGVNWTHGGGWADGTISQWPDWVQIDFNGPKTIDNIVVVTVQDDYQHPIEPTFQTVFTKYGVTDFNVQAWNGTQWVTLSSASNNNFVKRMVSFPAVTTTKIRVNVTGALYYVSRIVEVQAWGMAASQPETNVALASTGAVATASSQLNGDYPVSAINDNERAGVNWTHGGGWADGTINQWPDWVQIDFNGSQTIDRVVVYTVQDNYQNPQEPTDTMTFTQYGITDFQVQGWDGSQWVTLATVSGNNLVKRTVTFSAFTTPKIRINVTGGLYYVSRITEVEAWGFPTAGPPPQSNWALASNGATASASSQLNSDYPVAAAIDGDTAGTNWTHGGGWADGTISQWPDWLQVNFAASHTIDHVTVFTVQDNYQNPSEPTDTMTFTQYGIQDFDVQGWNGAQWVTLASVTNNNFVKRNVTFAPFTTDRIRVVVNRSLYYVSRITEVQAWGN